MLIVPMPWWLYFTVAPVLLTLRFAVAALKLLARGVIAVTRATHRRWKLRQA